MNLYENGKIYKLINDVNTKIYIGSTTERYISNRLCKHKSTMNQCIKGIKAFSKLYTAMNEIGYDHFKIILVETYPCKSKAELEAREEFWITHFDTINNGYNMFKNIREITQNARKSEGRGEWLISEKNKQQLQLERLKPENIQKLKKARFRDSEGVCKTGNRWMAFWTENEKHKTKSFSISKYGDKAKDMAIEHRQKMILANPKYHV